MPDPTPVTTRSSPRTAPARRTAGQGEPVPGCDPPEVAKASAPSPALEAGQSSGSGQSPEDDRTAEFGRAPARLPLPYRAFVVVGGVPGAGKSTLLHRLRVTVPRGQFSIRDPEDVRTRWERVLGGRRHYRLWRPLVYAEHYLRLLGALPGRRTIVLHDTATRGWMRRLLAGLARLSRRPAVLLWIDVTLAESLDGQRVRGRKVPRRTLKRHWRRWARLRPAAQRAEPGYAAVHTLTRSDARTVVLAAAPRSRRRP